MTLYYKVDVFSLKICFGGEILQYPRLQVDVDQTQFCQMQQSEASFTHDSGLPNVIGFSPPPDP